MLILENWIEGEIYLNKKIVLQKIKDIQPFFNTPTFPNATDLYLIDCNDNFVYEFIDEKSFPNVTNIYLASHPWERKILFKISKRNILCRDKRRSGTMVYRCQSFTS
jgi:hypothetical protein